MACEVLLAHAAGWKRIELYARFDQTITDEARGMFRELVQRAAEHEPIAYLVGKKEFYSLEFQVDQSVLIPRPETETLVEVVFDHLSAAGNQSPHVLDIGTGSGCIAIALLKQLPEATAVATDNSADALAVAQRNAEQHDVAGRITLLETNTVDDVPREPQFDAVLSNPPYVTETDYRELAPAVRDFEPRSALTDGDDGLSFYRAIAQHAGDMIKDNGIVAVEIGYDQREAVGELFNEHGSWKQIGTWKDRVEGHDRVIMFTAS